MNIQRNEFSDYLERLCQKHAEAEAKRLDADLRVFMAMGYRLEELIIASDVHRPDIAPWVTPMTQLEHGR